MSDDDDPPSFAIFETGGYSGKRIRKPETLPVPQQPPVTDEPLRTLREPSFSTGNAQLPPDVVAFGSLLAGSYQEVSEIKRQADGMVLGLFGLDALLGMVPVVGSIYSAGKGFQLLNHAIRTKCGGGTITFGVVLVLIDMVISLYPVVGGVADALFRSHAFFANRILSAIEEKAVSIRIAQQWETEGKLTAANVTELRDILVRGGKSEHSVSIRNYILLGIAGFLLYSCVQDWRESQQATRECQARGGWLCSWRY